MSSHAKRNTSRRKANAAQGQPQSASDAGVYVGLLMIGLFVGALVWVAFRVPWQQLLVAYAIAVLGLINFCALQVYLGKTIPNWQQALARLPMRVAGYGKKGGKPLAEAKGQADARTTLFVFFAGCVVLIAGLTVLLIR